jgi:polysaccharide biosynthesis transport protein
MEGPVPPAEASFHASHPSRGERGSELSLRELPRAFRRRWLLFVQVVGGVIAVVMLVTLLLPPSYESEASVRVRSDRPSLGEGLAGGGAEALGDALPMAGAFSLPGLEGADVPTEIGVLGSRRILEAVIDSLSLHVELSRPWREFRTDVLRVIEAGEDAPRGIYSLRLAGDGSYTVSARGTDDPVALPERVEIGQPFRVGPMLLLLEPDLAGDPPSLVRFRVQPFRRVVRSIRREIQIERDDTGSRLIVIQYRHKDPRLAQAMVNGIVDFFMDYSLSVSTSDSRREARILAEQVEWYAERLGDVESRLQRYQEQERIIAPDEQALQQVRRMAQIRVATDAMEVEREALADLLRSVSEAAGDDGARGAAYRRLATFPSFIANNAVQQLLTTLTNLENERSALLVRRMEGNLDVRRVQERIGEVERQIFTLATDYLESLDTHLVSSRETLGRFGAEAAELPAVELAYARLVRERRLISEIYLTLHARMVEAQVQEAIDDARVRVVDLGVVEDRPVFPRPGISLLLSTLLGLMLGTFAVVAVETTTPFARSRAEAEEAAGAPVLGVISPLPGQHRGKPMNPLVTRSDPWHAASEGFRGLALTLLAREPAPRMVVVASPGREEGRTTVAANLATALAQQGRRVALLDGDLRAGTLHGLFHLTAQPGWASAVVAGAPIEDVVREAEFGGQEGRLDILPGGVTSSHPVEILVSDRVRTFLAGLRERYDVVVIDTPSLEDGYDAAVLAGLADGVLLVSRSGETRKVELAEAANALRRARGKVLGVVLMGADPEAKGGRFSRTRA